MHIQSLCATAGLEYAACRQFADRNGFLLITLQAWVLIIRFFLIANGVGMGITPSVLVDHKDPADETKIIQGQPDKGSAIIDLIRGDIKNVYGGSYKEGVTRRTLVNVPEGEIVRLG